MKRKIAKISLATLLIALTLGFMFLGYLTYILNCSIAIGSRLEIDKDNMVISVNDNKDIRILQLSDTQITLYGDAMKAMPLIKETVEKANPDLIVLTGDNLMNDSPKIMLKQYIRFFDRFEIPWALVMGNHDYYTKIPMKEMSSLYENGKHCLFKQGYIIDSYGNYSYTIERNDTPIYFLIFMDNAIKFSQEHIDWYANTINNLPYINDDEKLPSMVFFHKPLLDTYYAYLYAVNFNRPIDGERREGIAFVHEDARIFDKALELGSTKAMIYGHNHRNNFIVDYCNIKLCFGLKTGKAAYHDRDLIGGNVFILKPDNSISVERVFV